MSKLEEIEMSVESLPENEYGQFRLWFLERDWEIWDREIEVDSASGKLDILAREAHEAKASSTLGDL